MELSPQEKIEVNACLEVLRERWDLDSATRVISLLKNIGVSPNYEKYTVRIKKSGGIFNALTNLGTVPLKNDADKIERKGSETYHRIGKFKISRLEFNDNAGTITFTDFWKSDVTTIADIEDTPPFYSLVYDRTTLEPLKFTRYEWKNDDTEITVLGILHFVKHRIRSYPAEVLYSNK